MPSEYSDQVPDIAFRNPETNKDDFLCQEVIKEYQYMQAMSSAIALLSTAVINELLIEYFSYLVAFEAHETLTEEILAHTLKLFGSM